MCAQVMHEPKHKVGPSARYLLKEKWLPKCLKDLKSWCQFKENFNFNYSGCVINDSLCLY